MTARHLIFTPSDKSTPNGPMPDGTSLPIMGAVPVAAAYRPTPFLVARANEVGLDLVVADTAELPDFILAQGDMFLTRLRSAVSN